MVTNAVAVALNGSPLVISPRSRPVPAVTPSSLQFQVAVFQWHPDGIMEARAMRPSSHRLRTTREPVEFTDRTMPETTTPERSPSHILSARLGAGGQTELH